MNLALVRAVAEKDLLVVRRSRLVLLPMALVPILLLVVVPALLLAAAQLVPTARFDRDLAEMLGNLPPSVRARFAGATPVQAAIQYVAGYMWAPLYLLVPLVVASGIAADSFAGERERKTLEALLHTPLTDGELFFGKVAGAWGAALAVAGGGFVLYAVTVNAVAWPAMGRVFFPHAGFVLLVAWVMPAVALLALGAVVLLSARVSTAHEAFQASGVLVLPVVALLLGQVSGVLVFGPAMVAVLGAVAWAAALLVLRAGVGHFRRTSLILRV